MFFKVGLLFCFLFLGVVHCAEKTTVAPTIYYSKKSPFGLIEVVAAEEPETLKICENRIYDVMHSTFRPGEPTYLGLLYAELVSASFCFSKNLKNALLLGLGAGDFLSYMMHYFPKMHVDAVEINPVMIDIVKKFREKDMSKAPNYLCEDGFKYVDKIKKRYDLIFCDMYFGKPVISINYINLFEKLKNCLSEGGVFIFNAYIPFVPKNVIEDMFKSFENIAAAVTNDGANIVFICYQGAAKKIENLEKIAEDMQVEHKFCYSQPDLLKKFVLLSSAQKDTWVSKFPVLE